MEYLHNKIWLIIALLAIGFALTVGLQNDSVELSADHWDAANDMATRSVPIREPLPPSPSPTTPRPEPNALRPSKREFTADARTVRSSDADTRSARRIGFHQASDEEFDFDLPELDFPETSGREWGRETAVAVPPRIQPFPASLPSRDSTQTDQADRLNGSPTSGRVVTQLPSPSKKPAVRQDIPTPGSGDLVPLLVEPAPQLNLSTRGSILKKETIVEREPVATEKPEPRETEVRLPRPLAPVTLGAFHEKVRYANTLARRGAVSSAAAELKEALKLLAEALDQSHQTQKHSRAIHSALVAMDEVSDLASWNENLAVHIAGHETDVLGDRDLTEITFHEARLAYLSHAEANFHIGCGQMPLAAEAFRSLGKISLIREDFGLESSLSEAKAMLMFRIATTLNPDDALASRELGVLFARYNHLTTAKQLLLQSLRNHPDPATWQSLARIHQVLGETHLAQQAVRQAELSASPNSRLVLWANPKSFDQLGSMVDPPVMTAAGQPNRSAAPPISPGQQRR